MTQAQTTTVTTVASGSEFLSSTARASAAEPSSIVSTSAPFTQTMNSITTTSEQLHDDKLALGVKPRLLDLFCGAGGAAMGYHRAGFATILGIDIKPQPNYPFAFVEMDALDALDQWDGQWDAVHASPPCQAFSAMRVMENARREHPDLLAPTRERLLEIGVPFVIENVEQAPMDIHPPSLFGGQSGVVLCGSMFELWTEEYQLRRHRLFESNIGLPQPNCRHRSDRAVVGFYGDHARTRTRINGHHARGTDIVRNADKLALVADLMDIDWMTWREANQAIPPAYTEFIGRQLLEHLGRESVTVGRSDSSGGTDR